MKRLCPECKGRGMCGLPRCPITSRFYESVRVKQSDSYMGASPSVFVGTKGYPRMQAGPLLVDDPDTPPLWVREGYSIEEIVGVRARTIRGSGETAKHLDRVQEIALSATPLDVEVAFTRPISFNLTFDGTLTPVGLHGEMRKVGVLDNARTPRPVERAVADTDLKATDAVRTLYGEGVDVYHITQLLTSGLLGIRRKAVPTRWGITAVDDMLGSALKQTAARLPPLEEFMVFSATIYGNQITCILAPGAWHYEMIEIWEEGSLWGGDGDMVVVDGERRRTQGYSPIAGAYYSARLAVLDYLNAIGRSARAIVIRKVSSSYWAPLGTWVIREAARSAMQSDPQVYPTLREAAAGASICLGSSGWEAYSNLMGEIQSQKTLVDF